MANQANIRKIITWIAIGYYSLIIIVAVYNELFLASEFLGIVYFMLGIGAPEIEVLIPSFFIGVIYKSLAFGGGLVAIIFLAIGKMKKTIGLLLLQILLIISSILYHLAVIYGAFRIQYKVAMMDQSLINFNEIVMGLFGNKKILLEIGYMIMGAIVILVINFSEKRSRRSS